MTCDELRAAMTTTTGHTAWHTHLTTCDACLAWSIDQALAQTPAIPASPQLADRVLRHIAEAPTPAVPSRIGVRVAVAAVVAAAVAGSPMLMSFASASSAPAITHVGVLALGAMEACIVVGWALARSNTRVVGFR
jgi:hypothetical protein